MKREVVVVEKRVKEGGMTIERNEKGGCDNEG